MQDQLDVEVGEVRIPQGEDCGRGLPARLDVSVELPPEMLVTLIEDPDERGFYMWDLPDG